MTYRDLFYKATRLCDEGEITLGEYEEMTKPLDREVEQEPIEVEAAKLQKAYNKGYADGQKALAEHIRLCKEKQEPTTKNDLGVDCIDRNKAYKIIESWAETFDKGAYFDNEQVKEIIMACANRIDELPPITPQEPKQGHWYRQTNDFVDYYECSECGMAMGLYDVKNYCPNCGSRNEVTE